MIFDDLCTLPYILHIYPYILYIYLKTKTKWSKSGSKLSQCEDRQSEVVEFQCGALTPPLKMERGPIYFQNNNKNNKTYIFERLKL